jgi:hypothetical protein
MAAIVYAGQIFVKHQMGDSTEPDEGLSFGLNFDKIHQL